MDPRIATDEVIGLIAGIEVHRRAMRQESDLAAACDDALRKLRELLGREREALLSQGRGTRHPANIGTVMFEIARVQKLTRDPSPPPTFRNTRLSSVRNTPLRSVHSR
jgi:hypothetical protein